MVGGSNFLEPLLAGVEEEGVPSAPGLLWDPPAM